MATRGTEDQFNALASQLTALITQYQNGQVAYIKYSETKDHYYAQYGWSEKEFHRELNKRLGYAFSSKEERLARASAKRAKKT